jgi:hypothetical protein
LTPDQLGDGIDVVGREGDDGRARGQARDLLFAGIGQLRQARTRDEIGARDQIGDRLADGLGAEQEGLLAAARIQQAVREHVAALGISTQLDFVDGQEIDVDVARHGLDCGDPVAGPLGPDLLLAGNEGHLVGTDTRGDLVVDLARQQAQRQSDHTTLVVEHALDGEVGLAGIGRAENRRDVADSCLEIAAHI